MKILIAAGIFPPETGGPATYTKLLAEELVRRGHDVTVTTYSNYSKFDGDSGFKIARVKRSFFKPLHYYRYYRAVKKFGKEAEVIFLQDMVSAGYPASLATKVLGKPYVVKVTGDYSWERAYAEGLTKLATDDFQKLLVYPKKISKIRDVQIRVCKDARIVITPAEYLKIIVAGWGVKPERIRVVYNSIKMTEMPDRVELRRRLNLEGTVLVSAGRLVKLRRFDRLIELMPEIVKKVPNAKLVIVGGGPEYAASLMQMVAQRGLTSAVTFTGKIDPLNVREYVAASDLVIVNSIQEGLSHLILEALACGTPVVATDVGGTPEIIQHEETGLLFPPEDENKLLASIFRVLFDEGLRQRLQTAGKALIETKFSMAKMVDETLNILERAKA
ncbi:MAG: glycosyltransferase family 4 protein [Candidatus Doudnabacteria bacterium]|nr:glycosyltransferase family 4 protein [bacterium]MDZ4243819.1 glycosyltransferase family 4 protein [Candidatus Doudnabacteria bacterium]